SIGHGQLRIAAKQRQLQSKASRCAGIVRVEKAYKLGSCVNIVEACISGRRHTRLGLMNQPYRWITSRDPSDNVSRAICRLVVDNNDIEIRVGALVQERADCRADICLAIVGRHDDADLHGICLAMKVRIASVTPAGSWPSFRRKQGKLRVISPKKR